MPGSAVTATVEFVADAFTLNNDQIWLEVMYLGSSGAPIYTVLTDSKSDILGSNSAQSSSSATWVTVGLATPVTQKVSVTFTPQMAGFVIGRVYVAAPLVTVYVDPKMVIA